MIGIARTSQYYDLNEHPARLFICPCTRFDRPRRSSMSAQRGSHSPQTPASWIHQLNADLPVFDISTLEARTMPTSWREREYCRAAAMTFIGLLPACRLFVQNRRTSCAAVNDEICVATCTRFPLPGAIQRK